MGIKPVNDVESNREQTQQELLDAMSDLTGVLASDSTLQQGLDELADLLIQLNAKVNEGVPMTPADLSALEAITATVVGLPSDYPDATTHTKLEQIRVLLAALPTTTGLTNAELRAADLGVKLTPTYVSGSSSSITTIIPSTDVGASSFTLQYTGATGSALTCEASNDGVTWWTLPVNIGDGATTNTTGITTSTTFGASTVWNGNINGRYFRVRATAVTATSVTVRLSPFPLSERIRYNANAVLPVSSIENSANAFTRGYNGSGGGWQRIGAGPMITQYDRLQVTGVTDVSSRTSIGAAPSVGGAVNVFGKNHWSMQVRQTSGTVATCKVQLEGSLDGTNWHILGTFDTAAGDLINGIIFVPNKPCYYVRSNVVTLTGSSPIIAVYLMGTE